MPDFRHLIAETHRRSLWQVLGIYLLGGWVGLEIVDWLRGPLGLPAGFSEAVSMLLAVGLPLVLATAFVQEGMGTTRPSASGPAEAPKVADAEGSKTGSTNIATGTGSLDRRTTRPSRMKRLLTWRRVIMGGVLAFASLGAAGALWVFLARAAQQG